MIYTPKGINNILVTCTHGSHLYGTNGPSSDFDFKAVVLPDFRDLLLAHTLRVEKYKYDEHGNTIAEDVSMPANGYEAEHTPVQKFVRDYLSGQAYAVELVYAVLQGAHEAHLPLSGTKEAWRANAFAYLCRVLSTQFKHKNVNGMVGFAVKQTFDYVRRGERLNAAKLVQDVLQLLLAAFVAKGVTDPHAVRLDSRHGHTTVLDEVLRLTGLTSGTSKNQNKVMRTLQLNGREYLETTTLPHLMNAVDKLVDQYGERSTRASTADVDWKSLSHAVRVYEQVLELLATGTIQFPRPNAEDLKAIKNGLVPLEEVKERLRELDDQVQAAVEASDLPAADVEMQRQADDMLHGWLMTVYDLW